jgi:sulfite exporter TauE/SafE
MATEITWLTAFLAGLLGSVHCVGMCGGITGALTMGLPEPVRRSYARLLPYIIAYNSGRIISYVAAGALMGMLGAQLSGVVSQQAAMGAGRVISGVFMLALGVYIAGWWNVLAGLEKFGGRVWRHIEPLGRGLLPPQGPAQALGLGLVWGWLPCGLVYSALAWALTAGGALQGGGLMLAFGLGTLPTLVALGSAAHWLRDITRMPRVRQAAGVMIMAFGLYMLFFPGAHQHHAPGSMGHVHAP